MVFIPAGSEPWSGSVRPKQPTAFPAPSNGSHRSFCGSLPKVWIGYITSAPCTEAKLRSPESPRSSSCITRPYEIWSMAGSPYPFRLEPRSPISPSMGMICFGNPPAR